MFSLYLQLGFEHITDFNGYDHILFLIALATVYMLKDWKKVLVLITAFTIGHSITLALSTLNYIKIPTDLIEFLIPVTIFISALSDLFFNKIKNKKGVHKLKYVLAMFFGLIHGLGFSNYLRSLLGGEENILSPLFAFNIGLEIGQIAIIIIYLSLLAVLVLVLKLSQKYIILITSSVIILISIFLMIDRFPY
ncbi:MAG: HupE/UreJ family protein [Chlorobi bacterium]|nr:HupE/UreJ family protein [Chlorobiota bacterium]